MRLCVVEDDKELAAFVCELMREAGHSCEAFGNGASLLAALRRDTFDLVLLDWHLPDSTGFDLLKQMRAGGGTDTGIIMLTNQSDKEAIAQALQAGADDYIVKPETAPVIAARVEAVLRRARRADADQRFFQCGDYVFDRLTETVQIAGQPVALNSKEFALALLLFENIHRPMSRSYILETLWHADPNLPTRTLDMHISRIRSKLQLRPENGFRIAAVSGYGYRMEQFIGGEGL